MRRWPRTFPRPRHGHRLCLRGDRVADQEVGRVDVHATSIRSRCVLGEERRTFRHSRRGGEERGGPWSTSCWFEPATLTPSQTLGAPGERRPGSLRGPLVRLLGRRLQEECVCPPEL